MRDPAEREEGRLDPRLAEQREHRIGIAFDALRQPIPIGFRDHRFERADLEPVLDIDRQTVEHRRAPPQAALLPTPGCLRWQSPPSTHPRSESQRSELQTLMPITYPVFGLKKKIK